MTLKLGLFKLAQCFWYIMYQALIWAIKTEDFKRLFLIYQLLFLMLAFTHNEMKYDQTMAVKSADVASKWTSITYPKIEDAHFEKHLY